MIVPSIYINAVLCKTIFCFIFCIIDITHISNNHLTIYTGYLHFSFYLLIIPNINHIIFCL